MSSIAVIRCQLPLLSRKGKPACYAGALISSNAKGGPSNRTQLGKVELPRVVEAVCLPACITSGWDKEIRRY